MTNNTFARLAVLTLSLAIAEPAAAQCPAFSSVTFTSYGSACQPTSPSWCTPNLYGYYGSCSVNLALIGPSATFRIIGFGAHAANGSALLPLGGGSCPLWLDTILVVLDVSGLGLTQVSFPAPSYSLVGLTLYVQALYSIDCGPAGVHMGTTQGIAIQFN